MTPARQNKGLRSAERAQEILGHYYLSLVVLPKF